MGREFTFYDYFDADGRGVNIIKNWLNGEGKPAKAFFIMIIELLEASPPPGATDSVWRDPYTKHMTNDWREFIELRKSGSVQYRILGRMQNRDVFLVACGIHKDQHYKTDVTPTTARNRVTQMENNPAKYRRAHEHD